MYDFCIWSHACFVGKNPKTARLAKVTSVVRESSVSGHIGSNSGHHLGAIVLWCAIGLRGPSVGSRWCPGTTAIRLIGVIFQYLSIYFPDFQNIQENIFKNFWETKGFFFVDLIDTLNCTYNTCIRAAFDLLLLIFLLRFIARTFSPSDEITPSLSKEFHPSYSFNGGLGRGSLR